MDADMLVSWLLNLLRRARRSPAVMVCLLPLLQLCMKVGSLSTYFACSREPSAKHVILVGLQCSNVLALYASTMTSLPCQPLRFPREVDLVVS